MSTQTITHTHIKSQYLTYDLDILTSKLVCKLHMTENLPVHFGLSNASVHKLIAQYRRKNRQGAMWPPRGRVTYKAMYS